MIFIKLLSKLPMGILFAIADFAYLLVYYVVGYRKKVVIENMTKAFPDKDSSEIKALSKAFYRRFADFAMETLKGISISESEINRRVSFRNKEVLIPYYEQGKSVVLASNHQFNWEWALLAGCTQLSHKVDGIYQPLTNKAFDRLIFGMRSKFGGTPIPKKHALRQVIKRKNRQKAVAINGDQTPQKSNQNIYWTTMLHQDTAFYHGVETITQLIESPAFFIYIRRVKRGYYDIEFVPIGMPPYAKGSSTVLENYIKVSEKLIIEDPAGWLWTHRRWKHKKPENVV